MGKRSLCLRNQPHFLRNSDKGLLSLERKPRISPSTSSEEIIKKELPYVWLVVKISDNQNSDMTYDIIDKQRSLLSSQFWKVQTMKMWMLSKFFAVVIYIKTYDKKTSHTFFGLF